MNSDSQTLRHIESLVEIVSQLRGPAGCPWDKQQTHESLTQYTIEEAHELVEALEQDAHSLKDQNIKEELGDVLFQVALHSQLASERQAFDLNGVIQSLCEKLIRRHPHVFGTEKLITAEEVATHWQKIKEQEKSELPSKAPSLLSVSPMPALQQAYKIGKKTERLQFDWGNPQEALLKVEEEFAELREALENKVPSEIEHELGDVLFSLAQLARHLNMEPEKILRTANRRFTARFDKMLEIAKDENVDWASLPLAQKDLFWVKAKNFFKKIALKK